MAEEKKEYILTEGTHTRREEKTTVRYKAGDTLRLTDAEAARIAYKLRPVNLNLNPAQLGAPVPTPTAKPTTETTMGSNTPGIGGTPATEAKTTEKTHEKPPTPGSTVSPASAAKK